MSDNMKFQWNPWSGNIKDLISMKKNNLPLVMKIIKGIILSPDMKIDTGSMYVVMSIERQKRINLRTETNQCFTLPYNCPLFFNVISNDLPEKEAKKLSELVTNERLMDEDQLFIRLAEDVKEDYFDLSNHIEKIKINLNGLLRVDRLYEETFLLCFVVTETGIKPSNAYFIIPTYYPLLVTYADYYSHHNEDHNSQPDFLSFLLEYCKIESKKMPKSALTLENFIINDSNYEDVEPLSSHLNETNEQINPPVDSTDETLNTSSSTLSLNSFKQYSKLSDKEGGRAYSLKSKRLSKTNLYRQNAFLATHASNVDINTFERTGNEQRPFNDIKYSKSIIRENITTDNPLNVEISKMPNHTNEFSINLQPKEPIKELQNTESFLNEEKSNGADLQSQEKMPIRYTSKKNLMAKNESQNLINRVFSTVLLSSNKITASSISLRRPLPPLPTKSASNKKEHQFTNFNIHRNEDSLFDSKLADNKKVNIIDESENYEEYDKEIIERIILQNKINSNDENLIKTNSMNDFKKIPKNFNINKAFIYPKFKKKTKSNFDVINNPPMKANELTYLAMNNKKGNLSNIQNKPRFSSSHIFKSKDYLIEGNLKNENTSRNSKFNFTDINFGTLPKIFTRLKKNSSSQIINDKTSEDICEKYIKEIPIQNELRHDTPSISNYEEIGSPLGQKCFSYLVKQSDISCSTILNVAKRNTLSKSLDQLDDIDVYDLSPPSLLLKEANTPISNIINQSNSCKVKSPVQPIKINFIKNEIIQDYERKISNSYSPSYTFASDNSNQSSNGYTLSDVFDYLPEYYTNTANTNNQNAPEVKNKFYFQNNSLNKTTIKTINKQNNESIYDPEMNLNREYINNHLDNNFLNNIGKNSSFKDTDTQPAISQTLSKENLKNNEKPLTSIINTKPWTSLKDVPLDINSLSVDQVATCLTLLNLAKYSSLFSDQQIDGTLMKCLDEEILMTVFGFNSFDALKLVKFTKDGWRPKL